MRSLLIASILFSSGCSVIFASEDNQASSADADIAVGPTSDAGALDSGVANLCEAPDSTNLVAFFDFETGFASSVGNFQITPKCRRYEDDSWVACDIEGDTFIDSESECGRGLNFPNADQFYRLEHTAGFSRANFSLSLRVLPAVGSAARGIASKDQSGTVRNTPHFGLYTAPDFGDPESFRFAVRYQAGDDAAPTTDLSQVLCSAPYLKSRREFFEVALVFEDSVPTLVVNGAAQRESGTVQFSENLAAQTACLDGEPHPFQGNDNISPWIFGRDNQLGSGTFVRSSHLSFEGGIIDQIALQYWDN